jgi:uncharacterized membrane protein
MSAMQKSTTTNTKAERLKTEILKSIQPRRLGRWAIGAAVALAAIPAALAQPSFFVTELAIPAGYESCAVYQINDQGFIAGDSMRGSDRVATIWKGGVPKLLGKLDKGTYASAMAINSSGVAVGDGDDGDGRPLGFITSNGKLVNFYSNNGGNTRPIAINDAGLVGGYFIKGFDSTWRGGIWKIDPKDARKSTLITLPILPGGDPITASATSRAFNKNMEATGDSSNSEIGQHAVFWKNDAAHSIVDLGVFGSDWSSYAYAINDLGQVAGESHPPFGSRAIVWQNDAAHTPVELPLLPGHNYGSAQFINSAGTVIGYSGYIESGTWNTSDTKVAIWIGGVPYDLQSLLVQSGTGYTLVGIQSINNLGQMVGFVMRDGAMRAVVLNPAQ